MSVKKRLVNNLPAHLKEHPNVEALFGAIGEFLDDLKKGIDDFKLAHDSQWVSTPKINTLADTFGVNYPRNLSRETKRELIRDIISVYRAKGTERAIKHIFRLVGWSVDIESIWIDKNQKIDEYTYPDDYYFGKEVVYSDGVYFDGEDSTSTPILKQTIYGETYPGGVSTTLNMIKTPYIKVIIRAEDYQIFTEDFVDESGTVYTFTETEKFEITQDIIDFFVEKGRPTTVALIEIVTPFEIDDQVIWTENDTGEFEDAATTLDTSELTSTYKPQGNIWQYVDDPASDIMRSPMTLHRHYEYFYYPNARPTDIADYSYLKFDGTDDYVALKAFYNAVMTNLCIEAKVRTSDTSGQNVIASFDRSEYFRFSIGNDIGAPEGQGTVFLGIKTNAGGLDLVAPSLVADGEWHHVAATYNPSNGKATIYVDGDVDDSASLGTGWGSGLTRYGFIGVGSEADTYDGAKGPSSYFNGDIAEVRVWDVVRSQSQIQANMNKRLKGDEQGLRHYWRLNEGVSTVARDRTANRKHGELKNGPVWDGIPVEVYTGTYPIGSIPTEHAYQGRVYRGTASGAQKFIPVTEDARLKITCDENTNITVYRTIAERRNMATTPNYEIVSVFSGPLDEQTLTVKNAYGVAVNIERTATTPHDIVAVEIGYSTDAVLIEDWDATFGDDWGSIASWAHFYVPNYYITDPVDITWDFGDTTLV